MLVLVIVISVVALFACTTFVCSAVANKKFFGRRYNGNPLLKYFTAEDFPNLDAEAVSFVSDKGQMLKGYVYTSSAVPPRGLIIFSHGFGAGHQSYTTEINTFAQAGFAVLAYDGTGCVASEGKSFYGFDQGPIDLSYAIRFARTHERLRQFEKIVLVGHSWGAFTVMNCVEEQGVAGAVAMCGFVEGASVVAQSAVGQNKKGKAKFFRFAFYPWLCLLNKLTFGKRANWSSLKALKDTSKPVLLLYGEKDKTVYFPNNGKVLQQGLADKKNITFVSYADKGHNVYLTCEAEREMNRVFAEIAKVAAKDKARAKEMYAHIDYEEITKEDGEVMGRAVAFCRGLLGESGAEMTRNR